MDTDLSQIYQNMQIDSAFRDIKAERLLISVLIILVLAEKAINCDDLVYWNVDNKLDKHRTVRNYDTHVQKMLRYLEKVGRWEASVETIESNSYSYTIFYDSVKNKYLRVLNTFDPKAKYQERYLNMNQDIENPRFAYIKFSLNKDKTEINQLKLIIPDTEGKNKIVLCLLPQFEQIKLKLGQIRREDIFEKIESLKVEANRDFGEIQ